MNTGGSARATGHLGLEVLRADGAIEPVPDYVPASWSRSVSPGLSLTEIIRHGAPQPGLPEEVNIWRLHNQFNLWRRARKVLLARRLGIPFPYGALWLKVLKADGREIDYGLASLGVITTAGVGFVVDAFQNLVELENMKYHALGTGTNAEASGDTALQTELTTQYNPDNTRATGTTTESAANIYRTVGTNTLDASATIAEHGVMSQAATGGGVLFDRSVFTGLPLGSGDGLASTYDATFPAGG